METGNNTGSYYVTIPGPVFDHPTLSLNAKCLYGIIQSLSNKRGFCWATNKHFCERFGVDESSIKRWLNELKAINLIETSVSKTGVREIWSTESKFLTKELLSQGGSSNLNPGGFTDEPRGSSNLNPPHDENSMNEGSVKPSNKVTEEANIKVNIKDNRPSANFEEFMEAQGYKHDSIVDSDGGMAEWWEDESGRKLSKSEVKSLRAKWRPPLPSVPDPSLADSEKLVELIKRTLEKQYGNSPVIGNEAKAMIRQNLIKKYDKEFIREYAQWYFVDSDIDKKWRFSIPAFTSEKFINSFLAQQ